MTKYISQLDAFLWEWMHNNSKSADGQTPDDAKVAMIAAVRERFPEATEDEIIESGRRYMIGVLENGWAELEHIREYAKENGVIIP